MENTPCSAYEQVGGVVYFARMLDKIRLHSKRELPALYLEFLGAGFDGRCCSYLGVDYDALRQRTLLGGANEEILEWCFQNGRRLSQVEMLVWNGFATKRGWRDGDAVTAVLQGFKEQAGLGDRDDIMTFFDFYDMDEGRTS
jgi:hypothetical protein